VSNPPAGEITADVPFGTFESARYGYSIGYPEIWSVREATRSLSNMMLPYDFSDATDYFSATAPEVSDPGLIVAAQPLDPGTTLAEWTSQVETFIDPCVAPATQETVRVDGSDRVLPGANTTAFHY
jgi:hypothetical protein